MTLGGGTITAPASLLLYQGRPFSNGRSKYYGSFRLTANEDLTGGMSASMFTPAFPFAGTENNCDFKVVVTYDDGRLTTPYRVTFQG